MRKIQLFCFFLGLVALLNGCGGGGSTTTTPPPVAAQFSVTSSVATTTAGTALNITVQALDATGAAVRSYSGTVHFNCGDPLAVLPKDSALTNGTGSFSVILKTAGTQQITAADSITSSIAGGVSINVNPGAGTQLSVASVSAATTGFAFNINVNVQDTFGNLATGYSGTVHFTSSDTQATLPSDSPMTGGTGNFSATLKTLGNQTITAADTVTASLKGTSGSISVVSNAPTHLSVSGPGSANTRAALTFTVSALDAANNLSTGYVGTVHFTSSDTQAILPANSTLAAGTSSSLSATLETVGTQTLTATDTATAAITGSASISVAASAALAISSGMPPTGAGGDLYNPRTVRICILFNPFTHTCTRWRTEPTSGFPLAGTGGVPPYTWSWTAAAGSSLPPGLSVLNPGNPSCLAQSPLPLGLPNHPACIFGTPTQVGTYNVVLAVTDSGQPSAQTTANYIIVITLPPPPVVNTTPPLPGVLNLPYSFTFTASGNLMQQPFTWSESGALPPGLAFNNSMGTLSGTPTQTGSFPTSVTATDQFNQASAAASFTIVVTAHGFIATGSMATARRFHTATRLANGKVLVAGGEDAGSTAFASAELYDPSTGTFSPTGDMTVPRVGHTATLLNSGKVLITGGTSDASETSISSAELYDPATGTFSATSGNMTAARVSHTATLLKDGTVFVTGGDVIFFNGVQNTNIQSLASAEIFDPTKGTFTATGSLSVPRESHTATLLNDGRVLIAGGSNGAVGNTLPAATMYASAELFDPSTGHFTTAGSMTVARDFQAASLLSTGKVLVAGGASTTGGTQATADLFDPSSTNFAATGNMTTPRYYHDATTLNDGTVLLTGGSDDSTRAKATAEIYDPTAGTFTSTGSMISVRVWHTSTLLQNGKVLVTGGADNNSTPLATAELYQ